MGDSDLARAGVIAAAADGDTSAWTGHLHVFVDRPQRRPALCGVLR